MSSPHAPNFCTLKLTCVDPSSGLSIEQRKRLTLATELVAKPSLLFLDEPTSGLDGQSAYEVCRFMRKLAAAGQYVSHSILPNS